MIDEGEDHPAIANAAVELSGRLPMRAISA
jgi:hypothetical protein